MFVGKSPSYIPVRALHWRQEDSRLKITYFLLKDHGLYELTKVKVHLEQVW